MSKIKLIRNTPCCSIEHAAQILECSIVDIENFLSSGAIRGYIWWKFWNVAETSLLLEVGERERIEGSAVHEEPIRNLINTELSKIEQIEILDSENELLLTIKGIINGIWALDFTTTVQLLAGDDVQAILHPTPKSGLPFKLNSTPPSVIGFKTEHEITLSDIQILGHDLERLYESLYEDAGPLPNIFSDTNIWLNQESMPITKRSPRTEVAQSDMIKALLSLLPDLKRDMENSPTNAPSILDACLEQNGLPRLCLGDKNFHHWMKKAKYNR